ncbi:MAG: dephospho-CoA kinase [Clostridiales bacterium]|jgi:dephospho-CoA kinase|nr:dephospho-CoA kinase [Clostridiales bacterium]
MTPNKFSIPIIGVTGNSGAGKSSVSKILESAGGFCIDADKLAHNVLSSSKTAYDRIIQVFGDGILKDGLIDRKKLGSVVFKDEGLRKQLETIVHSEVIVMTHELTRAIARAIARAAARAVSEFKFAVWDAPLLVEAGMHKDCDYVCLVTAEHTVKLNRIVIRDNISSETALLRLNNQPSEEDLLGQLIDDLGSARVKVIDNSGNIEDIRNDALNLLEYIISVSQN